jgi:hypothetical protein
VPQPTAASSGHPRSTSRRELTVVSGFSDPTVEVIADDETMPLLRVLSRG